MAILLFKTYAAFVQPALVYGAIDGSLEASQRVLWELAGRNIVALLAMRSRNAMFLAFTMILGIVREGFDRGVTLRFSQGDPAQMAQALSFIVFLGPYGVALRPSCPPNRARQPLSERTVGCAGPRAPRHARVRPPRGASRAGTPRAPGACPRSQVSISSVLSPATSPQLVRPTTYV